MKNVTALILCMAMSLNTLTHIHSNIKTEFHVIWKTYKTCQFEKNRSIRLLFLFIAQLTNQFIQHCNLVDSYFPHSSISASNYIYYVPASQRLDSSYIACQWVDLNTEVYLMRGESFGVRSFLPPASFNVMYLLRL